MLLLLCGKIFPGKSSPQRKITKDSAARIDRMDDWKPGSNPTFLEAKAASQPMKEVAMSRWLRESAPRGALD